MEAGKLNRIVKYGLRLRLSGRDWP